MCACLHITDLHGHSNVSGRLPIASHRPIIPKVFDCIFNFVPSTFIPVCTTFNSVGFSPEFAPLNFYSFKYIHNVFQRLLIFLRIFFDRSNEKLTFLNSIFPTRPPSGMLPSPKLFSGSAFTMSNILSVAARAP